MTTAVARQFRIRGRVQGVGFRYWTQREAQRLGLSGWVRNLPDRSVEAGASGSSEQLNEFERWLQHGPPGARVDQLEASVVEENELAGQAGDSAGFVILR
ncbi:acylphosphatase [Granulosicoccus sp. 3-233]|uniref:acylphosphatase n=1 Tax=Granulosicoccus sp. 3-233 TaxID=3417969 RepID=UPI003D351711